MAIWNVFVGFLEQALLWFATLTGNAWVGIILFTVCARLIILPLTLTSIKSSRRMQELQPKIKELQRKYGKDQKKLQEETVKIYQEYKVNPLGGCLPMLLQLPIFIGVYWAVLHLMDPTAHQPVNPDVLAKLEDPAVQAILVQPFLGVQLGMKPFEEGFKNFHGVQYLVLPILSIVLQYTQQLMAMPRTQDPQQKAMSRAMLVMPLFFGYITFIFPAGAVLYWTTSSVIGILQQYFTSGWGSLANHLKFLPVDNAAKPALATAGATAGASGTADGGETTGTGNTPAEDTAPEPPGFWDVLRPLTDLDDDSDDGETDGERTEPATASKRPSSPSQKQKQQKQSASRRQRRRR